MEDEAITDREFIENMLTEDYECLPESKKIRSCTSVGAALFHKTFDMFSAEKLAGAVPAIQDAQDLMNLRRKAYKKRLKNTDPRTQEWEELSKEYEKTLVFARALGLACLYARGAHSRDKD